MGRINRINFESMPIRLYTSKSKTMLTAKAVKGTPCGEQGRYIRIPVGFFDQQYAALFPHPEKILFYEWAKYKWGVFVSEDSEPCTSVQELFLTPNGTDCTNQKDKSLCFTKIVENMSDQCRFCNGKSVWDILSKHSDFTNTIAFKPSDREMIRPRIKVYHQAPRRIILALDASTSMLIGGKLEMVRQAAKRFIYAISEGKT